MLLRDVNVTVVGSGTGGASAALLLAHAGARVALLERVAKPKEVGAGILLQPNGLAVLYGLGLRDQLTALASSTNVVQLADQAGRTLAETQVLDCGGLRYGVQLEAIGEAETGKSDAILNVRKCLDAGFDKIICFPSRGVRV